MDKKNKEILKILVKDGRAKIKEIAKKVELPITTVYNRMIKMQDQGVFKVSAKISRKKLGYVIDAYILVNIDTSIKGIDQEKLAHKITALPHVLMTSVVTGSKDMIVRVTAKSIEDLSNLILKEIRKFEGVAGTETLVVMKESKSSEASSMARILYFSFGDVSSMLLIVSNGSCSSFKNGITIVIFSFTTASFCDESFFDYGKNFYLNCL